MCENLTSEVMWHKNSRRNLPDLLFNKFSLANAIIILMVITLTVLTVILFDKDKNNNNNNNSGNTDNKNKNINNDNMHFLLIVNNSLVWHNT